jgi:hypothetical protein
MQGNHLQIYRWVNACFNISSNHTKSGGSSPIPHTYTPIRSRSTRRSFIWRARPISVFFRLARLPVSGLEPSRMV